MIAGIVFAMFEMVMAVVQMGTDAFFMPLRMIGAMLLGPAAMEPSFPLLPAAGVGMGLHLVLSMLYGVAFAVVVGALIGTRSPALFVGLGVAFGLVLLGSTSTRSHQRPVDLVPGEERPARPGGRGGGVNPG